MSDSPSTMPASRNVFTVSKASATSTPCNWREDIDMPAQQTHIKYTRDMVQHHNIVQDYSATCSSRKNHRAFLAALIGEARRNCAQRGANVPDTIFVEAHAYIRVHMSDSDVYPKLLEELSALRMFHLGTKPKKKTVDVKRFINAQ